MASPSNASPAPRLQSLLDRAHAQLRERGQKLAPVARSTWSTVKDAVGRAADWILEQLGPFAAIARTLGRFVVDVIQSKVTSWLERRSRRSSARAATAARTPDVDETSPASTVDPVTAPAPAPERQATPPAADEAQAAHTTSSSSALVPTAAAPVAIMEAENDNREPARALTLPEPRVEPVVPAAAEARVEAAPTPPADDARSLGPAPSAASASRPEEATRASAMPSTAPRGRTLVGPLRGVLRALASSTAGAPPPSVAH